MEESVHPHIDRFDITYDFVHETGIFTHQTEGKMVFVREIGLMTHGTHPVTGNSIQPRAVEFGGTGEGLEPRHVGGGHSPARHHDDSSCGDE